LRDQLKDLQFYGNDLEEQIQREIISKENHYMIFRRIINRLESEKDSYGQDLRRLMREFVDVVEKGKNPKDIQAELFKGKRGHPQIDLVPASTVRSVEQTLD